MAGSRRPVPVVFPVRHRQIFTWPFPNRSIIFFVFSLIGVIIPGQGGRGNDYEQRTDENTRKLW
jgi:hypothetical protein